MYCAGNRDIDENNAKQLLGEYGSPLLILDESTIRQQYRNLKRVVDNAYPNVRIAYSVKTNYIPAVLSLFRELGASAEVVSGFEYWLAREIGFEPHNIIFNGPDKPQKDAEQLIRSGGMVNIDSFDEFVSLSSQYKNSDEEKVRVGIRVNTNLRPFHHRRFGFNLENGEVHKIVGEIKRRNPQWVIVGLHIHLGLGSTPTRFGQAVERISDCASILQDRWGDKIGYINVGGGFPVAGVRLFPKGNTPQVLGIGEYIKEIAHVLGKKFSEEKPQLIIEPGRYLIDQAGVFITTVISTKWVKPPRKKNTVLGILRGQFAKENQNSDLVQIATVDSSATSILKLPSQSMHVESLSHTNRNNKRLYPTYIAGNSCVSYDFLTKRLDLPPLSKGDTFLFSNAGAYSISRSEQFIHPRPAVALRKESGNTQLIRKGEGYEDMVRLSM